MCSPSSPALRLCSALLALASVLLTSCAAPGGAVTRSSSRPSIPAEPIERLTVAEVRGKAWMQRDGRALGLKTGDAIAENQPIQVGSRSTLRLQLGERAQFELAPSSRLVVHRLPREGRGDVRATWLRLEQGYLRILWDGAVMDPPMQISFGIWAARLRPGEYFFDTRERVAAACAADGSMRLSGVPEWTPQQPMQECLRLEARKRPLAIVMSDAQWSAVRAQRRLHPTLARAARAQSSAAIARLEREQVRSPGPRPPQPDAPALARAPRAAVRPPVATAPRTPIPAARPSRQAADDASRDRTAEELIGEAEQIRNAPRPATPAPRPPDPVMPAPAPSLALGSTPPVASLPALPAPTRPPPVPAPPPVPVPPPAPEPAQEAPPTYAQHTPPVIVIPAEPEPLPAPDPVADEAPIVVVEPPRTRHTPPVIVVPVEPEPEPEAPVPEPEPLPSAPPTVAMAAPPPPPPVAHTPPVITIPSEPEPTQIAPPPVAQPEAPSSSIELATQSAVVIPPSTQPPTSDAAPRARGPTPPSVPLDVAMYSVAAMPDKIGASESALIVPPTISHEPASSQWIVNVASYAALEPAQEHARMLVGQKLRAGVREQALPDRMSYLVVIEGFATEEAAETAAIDLETHFDLDPY